MARFFGTDGVRGLANVDLTPETALRLATSAAFVLSQGRGQGIFGLVPATDHTDADSLDPADSGDADSGFSGRRPVAVVGRDPRASGEMLEAAVAAGLASAGCDVLLLGVLPTPAVAFLTGELHATLGVVISASHNAMPDNGIKIFAAGGHKLDDAAEDAIEAGMNAAQVASRVLPTGAGIGRIKKADESSRRYLDHLLLATPHSLAGLKIVVDCAHGAASEVAPEAYRRAGAEVIVIAGKPNGLNINDGVGSTYLGGLREAVVQHGADLGIAHDGDADRCLAVDAGGNDVGGDAILAILATAMKARSELASNTVVTTVMANIGFHKAMELADITVKTTGVGDRYVLEQMRSGGYTLGGEQSGHFILAEHATTGDGLLTALYLMAQMAVTGQSLAELASLVTMFPQTLINVRVGDKAAVASSAAVAAAVAQAELELAAAGGRVLLRPSGTEPLVRVMVEASTAELALSIAERVAEVVAQS
ncbi:phosphoglucosamine mutase [Nakamurella antarctica]|uniref:Phosphoglucosamine mutase n=1 Tax=Nakamurella antarctica TaxID=1902245 RepID=A0A3G8ZMU0_9ACTN|nr:phosphoglucosamine mutase [Nakamurella antarctica]AZI58662.1 phosphoglucosamine mutase [Nakamurella antarctica]